MAAVDEVSADFAELEEEIRAGAASGKSVETPLATSERIIARVTGGIYREPWAAFRELVANAYDADASYVVVETDQPDFRRMTVRDDGIGMSPKTLAYVITHIGGSSKRTAVGADLNTVKRDAPGYSPGGRPLIGKIGIGLFAVAQLTQHFQIITKAAGESERLTATVRLMTHDEERFQRGDGKYVGGDVTIMAEKVPDEELHAHGTSVVLYQIRSEVRRTLQGAELWRAASIETGGGGGVVKPVFHIGFSEAAQPPELPWDDKDPPVDKFSKLVEASGSSSGKADLKHFDEYLRLIWKLSLALPLDYIDNHPFDMDDSSGLLFLGVPDGPGQANEIGLAPGESLRKRLGLRAGRTEPRAPFSVTFDGIALRRPIRLPGKVMRPRSWIAAPVMIVAKKTNPFSDSNLQRAGGRLSFEGYLYWNSKIVPTAGVLIRIREASGTLFDPTFLNYQASEQTRLRRITAEIFVHEGFDSAVNIDRESFNYSHPHFLYVQRWLHTALRLLVNRLKMSAPENFAKNEYRLEALRYASNVWNQRLGEAAEPPLADPAASSVPEEVGGAEIEWPAEKIVSGKRRDRSTDRNAGAGEISALAVVLEAYGVLSNLPVEERAPLVRDILGIPLEGGWEDDRPAANAADCAPRNAASRKADSVAPSSARSSVR